MEIAPFCLLVGNILLQTVDVAIVKLYEKRSGSEGNDVADDLYITYGVDLQYTKVRKLQLRLDNLYGM